jgi:hypothetical protein
VLCQLLTLYTTPVVFVALERLCARLRRRRGAPRFPRALPAPV